MDFIKRKSAEYDKMKQLWVDLVLQGRMTDDLKYVTNMVKKDVLRTDRHLSFFSGEGNANVNVLYNILTTYALNHPSVGYCQGMSDLLSPILVTMGDESHAYITFCALMTRMSANFRPDGLLMTRKFEHLSQGILYYDPELYAYLKLRHADDLLFCYRWLLLEMKREFSFDEACLAMEVLWSSLPPPSTASPSVMAGRDEVGGVRLFETRFQPRKPANIVGLQMQPSPAPESKGRLRRESVFSNVVSVRKRISSTDDEPPASSAPSGTAKKTFGSGFLSRNRRIQSAGSAEEEISGGGSPTPGKSTKTSAGGASRRAKMAKSKSLSKSNSSGTVGGANAIGGTATANENGDGGAEKSNKKRDEPESPAATTKRVKDLNDFYRMSKSSSSSSRVGGEDEARPPNETKSAESGICSETKPQLGNSDSMNDSPSKATRVGSQSSSVASNDSRSPPPPPAPSGSGKSGATDKVEELQLPYNRLPPPTDFGGGNPFLMFMCLACILQHRDHIVDQQLDYQEIAMYFDRMVRRHDVRKTLSLARRMFAQYLNDDWRKELARSDSDPSRECGGAGGGGGGATKAC